MSQSPQQSADQNRKAGNLRKSLDESGWRFTRQRAAVYDFLSSVHTHPTAEEVFVSVRQSIPNISLATVYKALEALVDSGLAAKLATAEGPARYDCLCESHYHIRCLKTGQVKDVSTPFDRDLLNKIDPHLVESLRSQGFEVTDYRLEIIGHFTNE